MLNIPTTFPQSMMVQYYRHVSRARQEGFPPMSPKKFGRAVEQMWREVVAANKRTTNSY